MKRIAALLLTLCLLLAAASAAADTVRVEFEDFSIELDEALLTRTAKPTETGGTFARYLPGSPYGDRSSNLAVIWRSGAVPYSEDTVESVAEDLRGAAVTGFRNNGRNVIGSGTILATITTIGGKSALYDVQYLTYEEQMEGNAVPITVFQVSYFVNLETGYYHFLYSTTNTDTVSNGIFAPLSTLIWK